MSDKILINGLFLRTIIGINHDEREHKQDVLINLALDVDTRPAARTDQIEDAVNYKNDHQKRDRPRRKLSVFPRRTHGRRDRSIVPARSARRGCAGQHREAGRLAVCSLGRCRDPENSGGCLIAGPTARISRSAPTSSRNTISRQRFMSFEHSAACLPFRAFGNRRRSLLTSRRIEPLVRQVQISSTPRCSWRPIFRLGICMTRRSQRSNSGLGGSAIPTTRTRRGRSTSICRCLITMCLSSRAGGIPDPDIVKRPFVAVPLAELEPDYVHPTEGRRLADIASRCASNSGLRPRPDVRLEESE